MTAVPPDFAPMREAIELALAGRWAVAPNPCVGAVLTRNGNVVARGWHKTFGGPHAEVEAIADARKNGIDPAQCTLWVTLEPCNHYGKTPPCTRAILDAGIKEVMIGTPDPNPGVSGGGAEELARHGVAVSMNIAGGECRELISDFAVWSRCRRAYSLLKLATTLDGRIATRTGDSRWVSSEESRKRVHALRSRVGAVLVGGNTFRVDNPQLTTRTEGTAVRQPLAVVLTTRLPAAGAALRLLRERAQETIFWTDDYAASSLKARALQELGCRVWPLPETLSGLDLEYGFRRLFEECQCHYVLCEGGGRLAMHLMEEGLADELLLFLAPKILGDEQARTVFSGRECLRMNQALGLHLLGVEHCGPDLLLRLRPRRPDETNENVVIAPSSSQDS